MHSGTRGSRSHTAGLGLRLVASPESRPRALKLTVFLADCVAHFPESPEVDQGAFENAQRLGKGQTRLPYTRLARQGCPWAPTGPQAQAPG